MRLARYLRDGALRVAVVEGDELVDVTDELGLDDLVSLVVDRRAEVDAAVARATERLRMADVQLAAPVAPRKFFGMGLNYADHIDEAGMERPTVPTFFTKAPTCVIGSGAAIHRPRASACLDYEGELGVVIGRRCRHVTRELAPEVIAGYVICNDVSVRDWQFASPTISLGKSWDTHGPIGPWLTSADEVDAQDLELTTTVNGEVRQRSNTRHMVHDVLDQVVHLSTVCTLEPGDVIATGTPAGVAAVMNPPRWLVPGDVVRVEISGLGVLENPVVLEPDDAPFIAHRTGAAACAG